MLKRLAVAGAAMAALTAPVFADAPKSADECLKSSIDLATEAEAKKLSDDKLAKLEEMLTKLEGHCEAQEFAEAATVTTEIKGVIAGQ